MSVHFEGLCVCVCFPLFQVCGLEEYLLGDYPLIQYKVGDHSTHVVPRVKMKVNMRTHPYTVHSQTHTLYM